MRPRTQAATATLAIVLLSLVISSLNTAPVAGISVPRNETVWLYNPRGAGNPTCFQPWNVGADQGWDTYLMYEPMFGTNVATNELIKWLGQDIMWINSTAIQITLRSSANWTNGTPITSDDVIFTFKILQQQNMTPALCDFQGHGRLGGHIKDTFVKVDATKFIVLIKNATYAWSNEVYRQLTFGWPIFPKSVWEDINATYCATSLRGLSTFANDWQDPATPAEWKVASGMYLPYWHDQSPFTTMVSSRNDNWWGKDDPGFGRLPAPKYIGSMLSLGSDIPLLALERGDLDWIRNYVADVGQVMLDYSNVKTYFPAPYYYADKSAKLLVPNHKSYPLNQTWLHKAIASVMNYTGLSALADGYLKAPSPLLIPWDDASARSLVNTSIEAKYAIALNASKGLEILNQYCTYDATTGVWWTKQGVTLSDPIKHYPLAKWLGKGTTNATTPWAITNFYGWTDVTTMDTYTAHVITTELKINMTTDQGPANTWGDVQSKVNGGNFDFYHHSMAGEMNMNMYERYFQLFSSKSLDSGGGIAAPLGNYSNPTLVNLIDQLDLKPAGSPEQLSAASQIQEIIGSEMPYIPYCGQIDWPVHSDTYWTFWPNNDTNPILPSSPYAGLTQNANLLTILFRLQVNPNAPKTTVTDELTALELGVLATVAITATVAVVLVAVLLVQKRRTIAAGTK